MYYDPLSKEKDAARAAIREQYPHTPLKGRIILDIIYFVQLPASASKKKKQELKGTPCLKKIDLDNLMKFSADCLKKIVFEDDSQIWSANLMKIWSDKNCCNITVYN